MEHSIEYYRNLVSLLEYICERKLRYISREEGWRMCPNYWVTICNYLRSEKLANTHTWDLYIQHFSPLIPVISDAKHRISIYEKAEEDRNLANQEKIENMCYGKKSYRISLIAILLSAIAIAVEVYRAITGSA